MIKTTNRQTSWAITLRHTRFNSQSLGSYIGVLPEICFYNLLKLGGDLPISSRIYEAGANFVSSNIGGSAVSDKISGAFNKLANRYKHVRSDFGTQVLMLGFAYQLPMLFDVLSVNIVYENHQQIAEIERDIENASASSGADLSFFTRLASLITTIPREITVELVLSEIESDSTYNGFIKGFFEAGGFFNSVNQIAGSFIGDGSNSNLSGSLI